MRYLALIYCLLIAVIPLASQAAITSKTENATASLTIEPRALEAGESIWAGIHFTLAPHWHIYWKNPGDSGLEVTYEWTLPDGVTAGPIHWPAPKRIPYSGLYNYGYEDAVTLLAPITKSEAAATGDMEITLQADWLICKEICIPESASFTFTLPADGVYEHASDAMVIDAATSILPQPFKGDASFAVHDKRVAIELVHDDFARMSAEKIWWFPLQDGIITNGSEQAISYDGSTLTITADRGAIPLPETFSGVLQIHFDDGRTGLYQVNASASDVAIDNANIAPNEAAIPMEGADMSVLGAIIFALIGGIILNAMPCVLPVLSLKALSISKKAEHEPGVVRMHGISYTAGIVISFLVIALVLISLKSAGHAIGWGFQLQSPAFVSILIYILMLVGLNLSGVFEIPSVFANVGGDKANDSTLSGSFFTGVLATLVATPCTAPFMAPAIGFTVTQSTASMLLIFAALGLGLALPLLLISFLPQLYRLLPKPGAWMVRFKQFLAFPIYASVAWLIWVLAQQSGAIGLAYALAGICLLAFLAWLLPLLRSHFVSFIVLAIGAVLLYMSVQSQEPVSHPVMQANDEMFSTAKLEEYRKQGTAVFIDATAAWCITCKVNEQVALNTDEVRSAFADRNIVFMVADWTNRNAEITEYLASFGRNGVPLYVYYAPNAEPVVLPQILTPSIVLDSISMR